MKRSKIFLGLTTMCLAVAALAAKNAHKGPVSQGFYTNANGTKCTNPVNGSYFTVNSPGVNTAYVLTGSSSNRHTLFSQAFSAGVCAEAGALDRPLYFND